MKRELAKNWSIEFQKAIEASGLVEDLERCLTCGKCVGNCPVAALTPSYNPCQVIREVLLGNVERLLASEEIWRCFWCAGCYATCPSEIKYPLLMLVLRYYALEHGAGKKYVQIFKRFVLKAREDGVTFQPGGTQKLEKIKALRTSIGLTPLRVVSEQARKEYQQLFEMTGTMAWLEGLDAKPEAQLRLSFAPGRITGPGKEETSTCQAAEGGQTDD
ncbi:MAG: 4Fe-4S binding protein [Firmicutes bacterium]|nr:4Fe-4S binding protein [Bacillota bacterium]